MMACEAYFYPANKSNTWLPFGNGIFFSVCSSLVQVGIYLPMCQRQEPSCAGRWWKVRSGRRKWTGITVNNRDADRKVSPSLIRCFFLIYVIVVALLAPSIVNTMPMVQRCMNMDWSEYEKDSWLLVLFCCGTNNRNSEGEWPLRFGVQHHHISELGRRSLRNCTRPAWL